LRWCKLILTTVVLAIALGGAVGQAATLQVKHKPFSKLTRQQTITVLRKQIHKDHSVIRFWHNHPQQRFEYRWIYHIQVHWARTSLKIASANLRKLTQTSVARYSYTGSIPRLICSVFGSDCTMALRVAYRESRYSIYASNGQYKGIFQMGSAERARFATIGYSTAYQQIVAAHNYFLVSGWSPWSQTAY
jgi:hypothetical protein